MFFIVIGLLYLLLRCPSLCLPAVMLPGGQPEPALTAVTLGSQMIRVPAGNLKRSTPTFHSIDKNRAEGI